MIGCRCELLFRIKIVIIHTIRATERGIDELPDEIFAVVCETIREEPVWQQKRVP